MNYRSLYLAITLLILLFVSAFALWKGVAVWRDRQPRLLLHRSITQGADVPMRAEMKMTWRRHGITHISRAHALLGATGRYRMEYLEPEEAKGRIVYSDGQTQWQFEPRHKLLATTNLIPESAQNERDTEDLIAQNYKIVLVSEDERVAGRTAYLLELLPRQEEKSSQKRWIDRQTFRTLRVETHYPDGILARMVAYTDLTLPAKVSPSDFVPPSTPLHPGLVPVTTPVSSTVLPLPASNDTRPALTGSLHALGLHAAGTAGFQLTQVASSAVKQARTAHLLYSDGIETISIFVQNGQMPALANAPGWHEIQIGTRKAFENLDGHLDAIVWTQNGYRYTTVSHLGPRALQQFVGGQMAP